MLTCRRWRVLAVSTAVLVSACSDHDPAAPAAPAAGLIPYECVVDVAAESLTCTAPQARAPRGVSADLMLGGQGTYVRLTSSGIANDGTTLSANVTVQNLTAQQMGTTDGGTPQGTGVRVFFAAGPTNGVTVANETSTGTFTASNQPYFQYSGTELGVDQILAPQEVSTSKQWQFTLNGATTFSFTVYISTAMPAEQGVLRWRKEMGSITSNSLVGVWGTGTGVVYAVGQNGTILRRSGGTWSTMSSGTGSNLQSVQGTSASQIFAVGSFGVIRAYNGSTWSAVASGTAETLLDVLAFSPTFAIAVGGAGANTRYNGSSWTASVQGTDHLYGVWGTGDGVDSDGDGLIEPDFLYAVGANGTILRAQPDANPASFGWTTMTSGVTRTLYDVWGTSANDVYAVGVGGTILHWDGSTWSPMTSGTTRQVIGIWGFSSSDIHATLDDGRLLQWDGSSWTIIDGGGTGILQKIWGTSASDMYAVGSSAAILHADAAGWHLEHGDGVYFWGVWVGSASVAMATTANHTAALWNGTTWQLMRTPMRMPLGVWGSSATSIYVAGSTLDNAGAIARYNGSTWMTMAVGSGPGFRSIHGTSDSDIHAVGTSGRVARFDGISWSELTPATSQQLNDVWAAAPGRAFAVGNGGVIVEWDGSSWSSMTSPTTEPLKAVWGTSTTNVYAVAQNNGKVLHYDGIAWTDISPPGFLNSYQGLWGVDANNIYFLRYPPAVLYFNGSAWAAMATPMGGQMNDIGGSSLRDIVVVGSGMSIYRGIR